MANTENIEAKLCAYIDGELDAQGRAEIEKHLAANPQHRGLIAELSKQRGMLRALPRETAPEEIMEVLQGQLERAGLLGDDAAGEADAGAMRINRGPQIMAAAAVVFLMVGLVGFIVYYVLPRQGGGADDTYAIGTLSTTPTGDSAMSTTAAAPAGETGALAGVPSDDAFARREVDEKREEVAIAPAATVPPLEPAQPPLAMKGGPPATGVTASTPPTEIAAAPSITNDVFGPRPGKAGEFDASNGIGADIRSAQERLFSADVARQLQNKPGGIQQNSVVMYVCASDPSAANSAVTNYLVSNNIQWEDVGQGPPAPLDQSVTREMHLSKNAPARVESKSMTFRQATQSPDVTIEQTVTLPPVQQPSQGQLAEQSPATPGPKQAEQVAVAPAATQSAPSNRELIQQRSGGEGQQVANGAETRRQRLIIARNMTQKQAADLNGSLLKESYVQSAACYPAAPAAGGAAATTQEITLESIDKQKMQNLGAGSDVLARSRTNEAPATQETGALADAAKDEPIAPVVAEAPTPPAQQAQPPAAAASVAPEAARTDAAVAPATAPTADVVALTQAGVDPAATQSLHALDEDQRVDVVIVVQDDQPIDGALMPNTEPNAASAPPPANPETQPAEPPAAQEQGPALPPAQPPVVDSPAP